MTELETIQRAKMYMDKLAQGIDPISNQAMPLDFGLNQLRLQRCLSYVSGLLNQVIENGGVVGYHAKTLEFSLTPEQQSRVNIFPYPIRIRDFVEELYRVAGNPEMKRLSTTKITGWLLEQGFLVKEQGEGGKAQRVPSEAGRSLGLSSQVRQSKDGEYMAVFYDSNAQSFLLDHLDEIQGGS